jgi:hypothetical protein
MPLPTRYLPAREVLRFRDAAFLAYYRDSSYLSMIGNRFGRDAHEQIEQMTSLQLERDLLNGKLKATDTLLPADDAGGVRSDSTQVLQLTKR